MDPALAAFFTAHPSFRLVVLGHAANASALDLTPLGVPAGFVAADEAPELVSRYLTANQAKFGGPLALPGWVLVDLYLLPGCVTLLVDDTTPEDPIVSAWCGVPTVTPGTVMGVSLISLREGMGAAWVVKRLGLAVLRARVQRGLTQWDNPALRAHARLGALRITGPAPAVHGAAARSFVYEMDLEAPPKLLSAQTFPPTAGRRLAARALAGEQLYVVSPGLDDAGQLVVARA